jgi:uncharacterized protein
VNAIGEILCLFVWSSLSEAWRVFLESSPYVILGLLIAGLLKVFLQPETIVRHLGEGRFLSVFKAALFGVPMPLCSCGVLPTAASLRRQGANKGAVTAFLIATPESGIDSIAISYALLDPLLTVVRPIAAFVTAMGAGIVENICEKPGGEAFSAADSYCPVDGCCNGVGCPPEEHRRHHSTVEKFMAGMRFAFFELWPDLAVWFVIGVLLAGVIGALVPANALASYLSGGLWSMLLILLVSMPMYICATASTPVAAALILKGVSPGAALVFLLAGPATNITSITVLVGVLGKRAVVIYLASIALFSISCGLAVDAFYRTLGLSPLATMGQVAEITPWGMQILSAIFLLIISLGFIVKRHHHREKDKGHKSPGCADDKCP